MLFLLQFHKIITEANMRISLIFYLVEHSKNID